MRSTRCSGRARAATGSWMRSLMAMPAPDAFRVPRRAEAPVGAVAHSGVRFQENSARLRTPAAGQVTDLQRRQVIAGPCPPDVQGGQEERAHHQVHDQSTNDDDGEGPLRIRSDRMRNRRGQQSERGHQHRHHDRPETPGGSFDRGLLDGHAGGPELVNVLDHDHARLNRGAEQRQESHAGGYAEVRPGEIEREEPAHARHGYVDQVQGRPLGGAEGAVNDQEDEEHRDRNDHHEPLLRAFLVFVFPGPFQPVARRQRCHPFDLVHGLSHGAAQIAAAHAEFDGHVARVALAIKLRRAVFGADLAELRQRDALAGGRQEADLPDRLAGAPVCREVSGYQVKALFALQDLADGIAADRGLDCILNVGDVDLVSRGGVAVHDQIQIRLPENAQQREILDSRYGAHDTDDPFAFAFEHVQVLAVDFDRKLSLDAADGLFDIVGNRLGEAPAHAGDLLQLPIHGRDELLFLLMEDRTPLFFWLEGDAVFGDVEIGRVRAVVGPAHLRYDLGDFRERGEDDAGAVHVRGAFRRTR